MKRLMSLLVLVAGVAGVAGGQFLDPPFVTGAGFNNVVYTLAAQPDGKILAGGSFTSYNGIYTRPTRINSDGSLDTVFVSNAGIGANNVINILVSQPDGKILIGGNFTTFNGTSANRIARLNSDGSLDTSFVTNTGTGASSQIQSLAIQANGKILVGGLFTTFNGTSANRIARLNSDGSLDTSFVTNTGTGSDANVLCLAIQPDGKILVGGVFTTFNGTSANRIARLNSDGSLDTSFVTNTGTGSDASVLSLAIQPDGKIVLGGNFTTLNGTSANRIARLNSDGSLDTSFITNTGTGANIGIQGLAIQSDGKILIGGAFSTYNGTPVNRIARLNSDGSLDTSFASNVGTGFNNSVYTLAIQSDGKILAGGFFTTFNGTSANRIARLALGPIGTPISNTALLSLAGLLAVGGMWAMRKNQFV